MEIKCELAENKSILLLISSMKYNEVITDIAKNLSDKSICYVTLNKTHDSLIEIFTKKKININHIVFIDAISKTIKNVSDQADGCYFVNSPGALTELSLAISKFLNHEFDYLIFDSLTNLLIYQKKALVTKFISELVNKIKESKTKTIFYALNVKKHEELIQETRIFIDKIIDLDKTK